MKKLKLVIRDNVRALLGLAEGQAGVQKVIDLGFSPGAASRILDDRTSIGVDKLQALAAKLDVEPWQLCVPGLDPSRLPTFEPASFRWPFRRIDPAVITGLAGTAAAGVENGLLASLATLGIGPTADAAPVRSFDSIPTDRQAASLLASAGLAVSRAQRSEPPTEAPTPSPSHAPAVAQGKRCARPRARP